MNYENYLKKCEEYQKANPKWRKGQTYFNTLYIMYPHIADEIRMSNLDPFHKRDDNFEDFLNFVKNKLNKEE